MDRDELIEELSFLYSEGVREGVGIPHDRLTPDIGALADKILAKMGVKPSWEVVARMIEDLTVGSEVEGA